MPNDDVPIFVDNEIAPEAFPFVRCNYLTIERDEPDPSWLLTLDGQEMPFMLIQLAGVITQPLTEPRFSSRELVEELFIRIEEDDRLSIEVADMWLPRFLFRFTPHAGLVFRMRRHLFASAFQFRNGLVSEARFIDVCKESEEAFEFSDLESGAFREWHSMHTDAAKSGFPKSRELMLRPRERDR